MRDSRGNWGLFPRTDLCIPVNFADELNQGKPQSVSELDVEKDTNIPMETRRT